MRLLAAVRIQSRGAIYAEFRWPGHSRVLRWGKGGKNQCEPGVGADGKGDVAADETGYLAASGKGYLAAAGLGQFRKEKEAVDTASETLKF